MTIKVVHCKKESHEYIGRPSALGNPFAMKREDERAHVVAEYRKWIKDKVKNKDKAVLAELTRLKRIAMKGDLSLGCWCAPRACHGDVIKEILDCSIRRTKRKQ